MVITQMYIISGFHINTLIYEVQWLASVYCINTLSYGNITPRPYGTIFSGPEPHPRACPPQYFASVIDCRSFAASCSAVSAPSSS